jgi:hypothetical protein
MPISSSNLFVVSYGDSPDFDAIYTDRAEAEKVASDGNAQPARYGIKFHYRVLTLIDAIDEAKDDARWLGEHNSDYTG